MDKNGNNDNNGDNENNDNNENDNTGNNGNNGNTENNDTIGKDCSSHCRSHLCNARMCSTVFF